MYWLAVYIALSMMVKSVLLDKIEQGNCFSLLKRCNSRYNCFAGMFNIKLECNELLTGEGKICTEGCRKAIERFSLDPIGKYFHDCSCERDAECLTIKARTVKCLKSKMNSGKIGCAKFSRRCDNNTVCASIMERFYVKCTHLISGTECTKTCEKVQDVLYSNNITKGLLDCECSGTLTEENFCRGIRAHTFHLCKTSPLLKRPIKIVGRKNANNKQTTAKPVATNDMNSSNGRLKAEVLLTFLLCVFAAQIPVLFDVI